MKKSNHVDETYNVNKFITVHDDVNKFTTVHDDVNKFTRYTMMSISLSQYKEEDDVSKFSTVHRRRWCQ